MHEGRSGGLDGVGSAGSFGKGVGAPRFSVVEVGRRGSRKMMVNFKPRDEKGDRFVWFRCSANR